MVKRRVLRTALIIVLVMVVMVTFSWAFQRKLIYFPDTDPPGEQFKPDSATDVVLRTGDGLDLAAWRLEPTGADRQTAVLVANGNGGNRGGRILLAGALADQGFTVLLFDYRGYGGNPGSPDESGLAADADAAYRHLNEEAGFDADRILFFGESLGCGVVAGLALRHPPAGMILRSPFVDLPAAGARLYPFLPVRLLLQDIFPVKADAVAAAVPTVVIYGSADATIPADQSREVADAVEQTGAPVTTVAVDGADHNDTVLISGEPVVNAVVELADRLSLTG